MAEPNLRKHLKLDGYFEALTYKYPKEPFSSGLDLRGRNRNQHGNRIKEQLEAIRQQFELPEDTNIPEDLLKDEVVYVDFTSEWGYKLDFTALDQDKDKAKYSVLSIRQESEETEDGEKHRYHVTVMMTKGAVSDFIKKVELYITENVIWKGEDTGNPRFYKLFSNIDIIRKATLKSFWTDAPEIPFPTDDEIVWWEVWFRKTSSDDSRLQRVMNNLQVAGVQIGNEEIVFAEHRVRLVKGSAAQLSQSLLLLDNLAELRKPQETADFLLHKDIDYEGKVEWLDHLIDKTDIKLSDESTLVCLLDSGVNSSHPLIAPYLPDDRLYSYKPDDWGTNDDWPNGGHGTGVAGLVLFGDLVDAIDEPSRIRVFHGLESYKIISTNEPNDPKLYGAISEYAISTVISERPENPRVFCLTVSDKDFAFRGRPSAWSAALDKMAHGSAIEPSSPQLILVASGNLQLIRHEEYPSTNELSSIHDPAQAYNVITVGSYTRKDRIDPATGYIHLAPNGAMAPTNSTSMMWNHQWPIKPDIVMEGGNSSTDGVFVSDHFELKMVTADSEFPKFVFMPFGDTSGATALAAKMAAELRTAYPHFWPETIRALMVHSAEWTKAMLNNKPVEKLKEVERRNLLRSVGYGIPNLSKALFNANNSLTLIAEREIQPYILSNSTPKTNHYHLFSLPWPEEVLMGQLFDKDVQLKITLSYFIEPNPGSRDNRYSNNFNYHSHNLEFAVIKPYERLDVFKRRISAATEFEGDQIDGSDEPWVIKRVRSRGSIKKDFITMSGADMSARNIIAVYPKPGWYKSRKKLKKTNSVVRYSLIVTLETPEMSVDLMAPVLSAIGITN